MKIDVNKLEDIEGKWQPFSYVYQVEELKPIDDRTRFIEPPKVEGSISRKGKQFLVKGTIQTKVEVPCDRCLEPIAVPINTDFDYKYIAVSDYESTSKVELKEEDLDISTFEKDEIDVDLLVNEQISLEFPSRLLCQEECKGICAKCGMDLNKSTCNCEESNIDPRWEALKKLKKE
jgi:uncharacterized protein